MHEDLFNQCTFYNKAMMKENGHPNEKVNMPKDKRNSLTESLFAYCLRIGDTSLILGQRLGQWCGHGPALEEDIAMSNMALDLIGQARIMLTYAGQVEGMNRTEDDLAFHRDEREFRNFLLAEQPNGDFACTIVRQFFLSTYMLYWYETLKTSKDETISGFAQKAWKEIAYHFRHSNDWMLRLGDGTDESHQRLQNGVNELWIFVDDLFNADNTDQLLFKEGIAGNPEQIREKWMQTVDEIFFLTNISKPTLSGFMRNGSRKGIHTEHLGYMLAEMQFLPRAYPDAKW